MTSMKLQRDGRKLTSPDERQESEVFVLNTPPNIQCDVLEELPDQWKGELWAFPRDKLEKK